MYHTVINIENTDDATTKIANDKALSIGYVNQLSNDAEHILRNSSA